MFDFRRFRAIFASLCLLIASMTATALAEDFVTLFDGKTTAGWSPVAGKPGNWLVKDGLLITKGEGGGWLSTEKTYKDFVLKLEYKTESGGNSGVFIRAPHQGDPAYTGMEIQILDDDADIYKNLKPFQFCGSIYGVVPAKRGAIKPAGEWNSMEITAKGTKISIVLNGTTIVDADLKDHPEAAAQHPGILRDGGYIGLQSHSDPVEFRNIQVKSLD